MSIGFAQVWRRSFRLGKALFPGNRSGYRHRVGLFLVVLFHYRRVRDWFSQEDNPWLQQARERWPPMDGVIYWPYLNTRWRLSERLAVVDGHYRLLSGPALILARAIDQTLELARFDDECPGLRLVLSRATWLGFEGEAALHLWLGDERCYSLAFSLGRDEGEIVVLLGALQGSSAVVAKAVYRALTRALHGMRPRDLLLTCLRLLAVQFGAVRILAVGNEARQCSSPCYGAERRHDVHVDLDSIWREQGGVPRDDGFFELPVLLRCRQLEEVPQRKRSAYKRRYRMLARTALALEAACCPTPQAAQQEPARGADLPLETS